MNQHRLDSHTTTPIVCNPNKSKMIKLACFPYSSKFPNFILLELEVKIYIMLRYLVHISTFWIEQSKSMASRHESTLQIPQLQTI